MAVDDSYTKSLLHMDVVFTDESGKGWAVEGDAQIDTAQSVFGGASGLFDGTGDYIDTPDHADFDVGAGDFTIDFRMRPSTIKDCGICSQNGEFWEASGIWIWLWANGTLAAGITSGGDDYYVNAGALSVDTWYHVALVRDGNTLRLFLDGTSIGTADVTGLTADNPTANFAIGRPGELDSNYYAGWIDEFRFSKGIARWVSNFTPPTIAYRGMTIPILMNQYRQRVI